MSRENIDELYRDLKKLAQGGEALLNEFIQKWLNQENMVQAVANQSNLTAELLRQLQKYQDILTTLLKIPTKDDIASIAKLVIQSEDKIDQLEDQIRELRNTLSTNRVEIIDGLADGLGNLVEQANGKVASFTSFLKERNRGRTASRNREALRNELKAFLREQATLHLHASPTLDVQNTLEEPVQEAPIDEWKRRLKNLG